MKSLSQTSPLMIAGFLLLLLVTACGRSEEETTTAPGSAPSATDEQSTPAPTQTAVATTDEPIRLPSSATGLAFWSHPTLPFESLIIAATGTGLYSHTLEGQSPATIIDGFTAYGLSIAYRASADDSGYMEGILATYDQDNQAFRFFRIQNDNQEFVEDIVSLPWRTGTNSETNPAPTAFCLINTGDNGLSLVIYTEQGRATYTLPTNTPTLSRDQLQTSAMDTTITQCVGDHETGEIFSLDQSGALYKNNLDQSPKILRPAGTASIDGKARDIALGHFLVNEERTRSVYMLNAENGVVTIVNAANGETQGAINLGEFSDLSGVAGATRLAVGSDNFGGIYRAGAVALASLDAEKAAVRLTSLLAVARALGISIEGPSGIRAMERLQAQQDNARGPVFESPKTPELNFSPQR